MSTEPDLSYVRHIGPEDSEEESTEQLPSQAQNDLNLDEIIAKIESERQTMQSRIGATITKKQYSTSVWDDKQRMIRIVKQKSFNQYIPVRNHLTPFEALFYMECRSLVVEYNNIPLTIQDAYRIFLNGKHEQMAYVVFAALSRLGYFVQQLEQSSSIEKDIESDQDKESSHKKAKLSSPHSPTEVRNNLVLTNVRPLVLNQMRKLNRFDRKLFRDSNSRPAESSESIIYDVQESPEASLPLELEPLYGDTKIRPLLSIGETPSCEELFSRLQAAGPKEYSADQNLGNRRHRIEFKVYQNRKSAKDGKSPSFAVILCEPYDRIPTIRNIPEHSDYPLLYCMVNDTLECAFFKVDNFRLEEKIPILWRAVALET